jgi:hypothetical protein
LRRAHLPPNPPPTPHLPAPTLSAGEHQVSGGEFKVSRPGGRASQSTRSSLKAQNSLPHFWATFSRLLSRRHGGATSVLFRAHGPRRCTLDVSIGTASSACLARRTLSLRPPSPPCTISAIVMVRKKITGDELNTRAKANGYQRESHREEDSRQDRNKRGDDTKKD